MILIELQKCPLLPYPKKTELFKGLIEIEENKYLIFNLYFYSGTGNCTADIYPLDDVISVYPHYYKLRSQKSIILQPGTDLHPQLLIDEEGLPQSEIDHLLSLGAFKFERN